MNITKKKCFCRQCSLQFDNEYILSLHLKVVHKHKNSKGAIKYVIKSNMPISSDEKSDSNNQIALGQKRKKTLSNVTFANTSVFKEAVYIFTLLNSMKERSHSNASFAFILVLQRVT